MSQTGEPAQVELDTDIDESEEFSLDGDSGRTSVADLTRSLMQSEGTGDSRDVDLASKQLLNDDADPLADAFAHLDEEEDSAEPTETQETPVVPTPAAKTTEQPQVGDDALWAILEANSGLDLRSKYRTPQDAAAGLGHAARSLGQRDEYAQIGRAIKENPQAAYEALGRQLGLMQQQEQAKPAEKQAAPKFDPTWQTFVDTETGDWKANTPVDVIRDATAYQRWHKAQSEEVITRFEEKAKAAVKDELEARDKKLAELEAKLRAREETEQQSESSRQYFSAMHQHLAPNAKWIFNDGDPAKGPTEAGQLLEAKLRTLSQSITDVPTLVRAAINETVLDLAVKPTAQTPANVPNKDNRTQQATKVTQPVSGNKKGAPSRARLQTADDLAKALGKFWQ